MAPQILSICLWLSIAVVAYAYFLYPALIWILSRVYGQAIGLPNCTDCLPTISLLIVAHNEESCIEERIQNALALEYPADRLEIVIASDGSSDGTPSLVNKYRSRGI